MTNRYKIALAALAADLGMSRPVRSSDEDLKSEDVVPLFNEVVTPMSADVRGLFCLAPKERARDHEVIKKV